MLGRSHDLASFFCISVLSVLLLSALPVHADTDCSQLGAGYRPATADDAVVKNGQIPVGTCYNPTSAVGIDQTTEQAKQQLNTMWCGGRAASCGPYTTSVDGLDPKFAACAVKFLSAVRQKDPSICMVSAYRSTAHQAYLCGGGCGAINGPCAAAGRSKHQLGLAIDIEKPGMNTLPAFVHQMAQQGGGVSFPVANDDGHMQPASNGGDCSTPGYVAPSGPPVAQRMQNMAQSLQSIFAPPQPQQCPAGYTLMNGTCMPQQALSSQQTTNPYSYLSSTPASSVTPSTSVNPSTSGTGSGNTNTNSNSNGNASQIIGDLGSNVLNGNTNTNVSGTLNGGTQHGSSSSISAIDLINQIANPTSTDTGSPNQPQSTSTPVPLGSHLNDTVTLRGTPVSLNGTTQASDTYQLSPSVSQTFVSPDLSKTPVNTNAPIQPVNSTFAILEDLKQKLLYVLAFLKPFGGVTPRTATANNSATAYME
jgi:hypothetical protein